MNELQQRYLNAITDLMIFNYSEVDDLSKKSELMFELVVAENNLIEWLVKICKENHHEVTAEEILDIATSDKITFRKIAFGIRE